MFLLWAIPLILLIIAVAILFFFRIRHRVHGGHREEGRVIKDE